MGQVLVRFCLISAAGLFSAFPAAAQVLYQDDFNSDTAGASPAGWYAGYSNATNYTLATYPVAADPLDPTQQALSTPGGNSRTTQAFYRLPALQSGLPGLSLSLRIYTGAAGAGWNASGYFQDASLGSSTFFGNGYGFFLNATTAEILMTTGTGSSAASGSANTSVALASAALPGGLYLAAGWNTVVFTWLSGGDLALTLNGTTVLSWNDTTYAPAFRALKLADFTANNATAGASPSGLAIYFDDIVVQQVPEPRAAWFLFAAGGGAAGAAWRRRRVG